MSTDYSDPDTSINFRDPDIDWEDPHVFKSYLATLSQANKDEQLWTQAGFGDLEKAGICLAAGANPKSKSGGEETSPLSRACIKNQVAMVTFLAPLSNLKSTDYEGNTAAHRCCEAGHFACLQTLADSGDTFKRKNHHSETPIFEAIRYGAHPWNPPAHSEFMGNCARCLDILIPLSDLDSTNSNGQTPIQVARDGRCHALADFMASLLALREKASIDLASKRGTRKDASPYTTPAASSSPRI